MITYSYNNFRYSRFWLLYINTIPAEINKKFFLKHYVMRRKEFLWIVANTSINVQSSTITKVMIYSMPIIFIFISDFITILFYTKPILCIIFNNAKLESLNKSVEFTLARITKHDIELKDKQYLL